MLAEDLDAFLDVAEHATQGVLDNVVVCGVFENGYHQALGGMATLQPTFLLKTSDTRRTRQGSTLRIVIPGETNATIYRVANLEPDGTGLTTLILERQ